ncbi:mRNA cleavage and polyadenylation factor subunit [Xanthoria calcicola]
MQTFTELTPPTTVTHSLSLPFLSASANNLVVAKTSLLQIFSLKSVLNDTTATSDHLLQARRHSFHGPASTTAVPRHGERAPTTKLVLIAQYELSGVVTSLARVKLQDSRSGGEALLVSLRNAKLSLVEWDPERYSISTISIHLYERDDTQGSPWEPDIEDNLSYLSVDPRSRCAALKFGARHLAILPFHQPGDDLVMDDYDSELDHEKPETLESAAKKEEGPKEAATTPYGASFVLSMLALDPSLLHPVHLAFLYEYRDPTFGVLSSQVGSSTSLLHERRDTLSYTVITLDLEQRASTALLSVNNLPYDLFAIVPLRLPIGGTLLIGGNEIIHVDQAGKTNGAAVNEFGRSSTSFALADQSDLGLRLEGCVVEQLGHDGSELLLLMNNGELGIVGFKIDGRSVSGLSVRRVPESNGGLAFLAGPSCASLIGRGRMFVGSEEADSVVLGWSRKLDKLKRQRSITEMDADEELEATDMEDDIDDDDDLYSGAQTEEKAMELLPTSDMPDQNDDYRFRIHDSLDNFGPMRSVALGKPPQQSSTDALVMDASGLELLATSGRSSAGGLTTFRRQIEPRALERHLVPNVSRLWTVAVSKASDGQANDQQSEGLDNYMITSAQSEGEQRSTAYSLASQGMEEVQDTEFDPDAGATIEVGTLNNGSRIIQVLASELRTFDTDFSLAQIFPMADEATGAEPRILSASFSDPFVLLVRDDESILVLRADESGELDEVEQGDNLRQKGFRAGSLYEDANDVFRLESDAEIEDDAGNVLMFLLTVAGGLQIFRLPDLEQQVYKANGLALLPPFLTPEFSARRTQAKEDLIELLVTDLGDTSHKAPYLVLRSATNDVIIYQPFQSPVAGTRDTILHFLKIPNPNSSKTSLSISYDDDGESKREPMRAIHDLNSYSTVFLPGDSPTFVIKSASSPPQLISLNEKSVQSLSGLNTPTCERGFTYIDQTGNIKFAQLPVDCHYHTGWVTRKTTFGEDVHAIDYHEPSRSYIIGVSRKVDFELPEDETHPEWSSESTSFLPQVEQGTVKLLDQKTWSIIDSFPLTTTEVVMCIKTLSLEISEHTHERQTLVCVGTAIVRGGEDLPAQGRILVFNVIDVVPEPDRPETAHKLKLIAQAEVKGAVTALSEIGTQGFLLAAQGQKCIVRGLKEDGSLLPVAFMDMQCYTTVAKGLKGTGMCLMGDAVKGVWFAGYYEDPYQLRLFGKSTSHLEVLAGDFLPDGKNLYLVVADADSNIHVFQFDPEHPKSQTGHLLLPLSTFHTASFPTTLTLLPSPSSTPSPQSILLTSTTGSLSLLTPLSPSAHRTLTALQSHLQTTLPHPLGLNPRAFRSAGEGEGIGIGMGIGGAGAGGRGGGVIDGMVVRRWMEGGRWRWWEGGVGVRECVGEGMGMGGLRGLV